MSVFRLPEPGRPHVLIEAAGPQNILDIDQTKIVDLYKRHGALLFRGFDADIAQFGRFSAQFCRTSVVNESPGRNVMDDTRNIHSVDGGTGAFPLHPELSREPWKPDVAFFACFGAPKVGGQTTICDGVQIVREMPVDIREGLKSRRLVYLKGVWPELLRFWLGTDAPDDALLMSPPAGCPYSFRRLNGKIVRLFSRPALHLPMFSTEPAFGNFLLFARFNNGRIGFPMLDDGRAVPDPWLWEINAIGDRLMVPIEWQTGDVLMIDNTRFMHGRTAIEDVAERQIATFFGYLRFAVPDPEEPVGAPWRTADFRPPVPPGLA